MTFDAIDRQFRRKEPPKCETCSDQGWIGWWASDGDNGGGYETKPALIAASVRCVVPDPFGGAGTVGLMADRPQRSAILIELNLDYAEIARHRILNDAALFSEVST